MEYKILLGGLAAAVGVVGFFPYIQDVFKGKTKPHAFSWIVWSLIEGIVFFAQLSRGAGAGAWVTGITAVISIFIAFVAIYKRETEINTIDWFTFCGAVGGVILWRITHNPLHAVILVTISDALAFVPTIRKSFKYPFQETLLEYELSIVKVVLALFALESYNPTTWLHPASLVLTNGVFVIMSYVRRRQLSVENHQAK